MEIVNKLISQDGSIKYLLKTVDNTFIESIKFLHREVANLCLSSQIGCVYKCNHCATGRMEFKRNLSAEEIFLQADLMAESKPYDVIFLGMGEPFLNLDNILTSLNLMLEKSYLSSISRRTVYLGTSGFSNLRKGLTKIASLQERPGITFSIHGVPNEIRTKIIPHNKIYNLDNFKRDIIFYQDLTKDKVTVNYTPLLGINDSVENYEDFVKWLDGIYCSVKIIPWNEISQKNNLSHFKPSTRINELIEILNKNKITFQYQPSNGSDIYGGCGQLAILGYPNETK